LELKELENIAYNSVGIPYNEKDPAITHSLETGFNCYTWGVYLHALSGIAIKEMSDQFSFLRYLRHNFVEVTGKEYKMLDIPMFYFTSLGKRHVGVLLDNERFTHCSVNTNGVAVSKITTPPWSTILRKVYRYKK